MNFVLCPLEDKQNQKLILPTPVSHTALIPGHHHGHWSEMRYSTITEVPDETDLSFKVQLLQIHIEAVHNSPVTCSWYNAETDTCNVSCFRYIVFGFYWFWSYGSNKYCTWHRRSRCDPRSWIASPWPRRGPGLRPSR